MVAQMQCHWSLFATPRFAALAGYYLRRQRFVVGEQSGLHTCTYKAITVALGMPVDTTERSLDVWYKSIAHSSQFV